MLRLYLDVSKVVETLKPESVDGGPHVILVIGTPHQAGTIAHMRPVGMPLLVLPFHHPEGNIGDDSELEILEMVREQIPALHFERIAKISFYKEIFRRSVAGFPRVHFPDFSQFRAMYKLKHTVDLLARKRQWRRNLQIKNQERKSKRCLHSMYQPPKPVPQLYWRSNSM